ncbi:hypothetical protein [Rhodopseudomonas palustris]|uniref:hypothetical protein n=1 Tax=Rhodopseudomonas palustris TaxID=1076 RepID=UPI0010582F75|nr:hypothetical protein [Rhodopseudomonas palustris]
MTRNESFNFAIHLHVSGHAFEEMAPCMVGLDADWNAEAVNPFADPFGDLLKLRVTGLPTAAPVGLIKQWLVQLASLIDVVEEAL